VASAGSGPTAIQLKEVLSNREMLCWVFNSSIWKSWLESKNSVSEEGKIRRNLSFGIIFFQRLTALLNAGRFLYLIFLHPAVAS